MFSWLFGGATPTPSKPAGEENKTVPAAEKKDPLASVRSVPPEEPKKLDLYDPNVLERISAAAKELQKSGAH